MGCTNSTWVRPFVKLVSIPPPFFLHFWLSQFHPLSPPQFLSLLHSHWVLYFSALSVPLFLLLPPLSHSLCVSLSLFTLERDERGVRDWVVLCWAVISASVRHCLCVCVCARACVFVCVCSCTCTHTYWMLSHVCVRSAHICVYYYGTVVLVLSCVCVCTVVIVQIHVSKQ